MCSIINFYIFLWVLSYIKYNFFKYIWEKMVEKIFFLIQTNIYIFFYIPSDHEKLGCGETCGCRVATQQHHKRVVQINQCDVICGSFPRSRLFRLNTATVWWNLRELNIRLNNFLITMFSVQVELFKFYQFDAYK